MGVACCAEESGQNQSITTANAPPAIKGSMAIKEAIKEPVEEIMKDLPAVSVSGDVYERFEGSLPFNRTLA